MAARGPLHVCGDDGDEATSRRANRSEAQGTPKGLARPRSPQKEHGERLQRGWSDQPSEIREIVLPKIHRPRRLVRYATGAPLFRGRLADRVTCRTEVDFLRVL